MRWLPPEFFWCHSNSGACDRICSRVEKVSATSGDGKLYSAIYAVYGSQTAKTFIPVDHVQDGIRVSGYISRPDSPRGSRNMQTFFVNERYVKSRTCQASLEEAYRSFIPSGKFPACVLFVTLNRTDVDVNVHPAKTEIKFADEKRVFSPFTTR